MGLIAALALAAVRSSALSGGPTAATSPRTRSGSTVAAVMAFFAVLMGGATANMAGAAVSCIGFPHCREVTAGGAPLFAQVSHRILAFLVLGHLLGMHPGAQQPQRRVVHLLTGLPVQVGECDLVAADRLCQESG